MSISPKTENQLERQANLFAAHASAPRWFIQEVMVRTYGLVRPFRYIGPSKYGFDVRGTYVSRQISSFEEFCLSIARDIRHLFWGLSAQSLSYRVKESGLVLNRVAQKLILNRIPAMNSPQYYPAFKDKGRALAMSK